MPDLRFQPLHQVATPADLALAAEVLRGRAVRRRQRAYAATTPDEQAVHMAAAQSLYRLAEWLQHQAHTCPG